MEKYTGDEFIEMLQGVAKETLASKGDNKILALINMVINNGDVVELLVDDLNNSQ